MQIQFGKRVSGLPAMFNQCEEFDSARLEQIIFNPLVRNLADYGDDIDQAKESIPLLYFYKKREEGSIFVSGNEGIRTALILDYDTDCNVVEWHNENKGKFEYYLHTSFKHTNDKHRFRVIVPVKQEYYMTPELKICLLEDYAGVDTSCFNTGRGFYGPALHDEDLYMAVHNEHENVLDINAIYRDRIQELLEEKQLLRDLRRLTPIVTPEDRIDEASSIVMYAKDQLGSVSWGIDNSGRFTTIRRILYFLAQHRDIIDLSVAEAIFDQFPIPNKNRKWLDNAMKNWDNML